MIAGMPNPGAFFGDEMTVKSNTSPARKNSTSDHQRVAILIDGGFFHKRYRQLYQGGKTHDGTMTAKNMYTMAHAHAEGHQLYRIFYYDCWPYEKKQHNPISGNAIDFSKTDEYTKKVEFTNHLKQLRKVALRMGQIQDGKKWLLYPHSTKRLLNQEIKVSDLTDDDVFFDLRQKGVDIKIGLDIASMAYKRFVDQIVLVSGDSDFVSAAKLARREGIDFILDPMWNHINPELFEHIDGLRSTSPRPGRKTPRKTAN